jgi:hypothetical protein
VGGKDQATLPAEDQSFAVHDGEIRYREYVGGRAEDLPFDPYARRPTFACNVEVKELPVVKLNDFAQAHGGFTFKEGTFKMAMEASSRNGTYQGYIEPVFDHMVIFNEQSLQNPAKFVWEAILGALTEIVRNHPKDRFGTKVPFSGTFEDPHPDIFATATHFGMRS